MSALALREARELESQVDRKLQELARLDAAAQAAVAGYAAGATAATAALPTSAADYDPEADACATGDAERDADALLGRMQALAERLEAGAQTTAVTRAQAHNLRTTLTEKRREFSRLRDAMKRRRESALLLRSARSTAERDTTAEALLARERIAIRGASQTMDENIERAVAVQDAIRSQLERLSGASASLVRLGEGVPGINTLISAASRKRTRDNLLVAASVAVGLCVTFWWVALI